MLERRITSAGLTYYASPLLERVGVPHAFSTRIGGVSPPPFDSLNLGNPSDCAIQDSSDTIAENYRRLQLAIGCGDLRRCWVHQVHGGLTVVVEDEFENGVKADAIAGRDPRTILSVRVADCVPVLVATANGSSVAAVHAGWRGVVGGIVPSAISLLVRSGPAKSLIAAIGPCIGQSAFEVGPEVVEAFESEKLGDAVERRSTGKGHVDLRTAVQTQLIGAGVSPDRIDSTDRCTFRDLDEFFSHRRDKGITGRMAALIAPRVV